MLLKAEQYESLLTATGQGAWGRLDYRGNDVNLRVETVKMLDGTPRIYFDGNREQSINGLRFQPVSRDPYRLKPGYLYQITTNVEFIKEIPKGMHARIGVPYEMSQLGIVMNQAVLYEGFRGRVMMTIFVVREVEFEDMIAMGTLSFYGEPPVEKKETKSASGTSSKPKDAPKSGKKVASTSG